jgi:hypothetical protein
MGLANMPPFQGLALPCLRYAITVTGLRPAVIYSAPSGLGSIVPYQRGLHHHRASPAVIYTAPSGLGSSMALNAGLFILH